MTSLSVLAQQSGSPNLSTEEIDRYKKQVEELVNYFEGTINFLGNPEAVTKEKEIVINDSYLKIFKDDKVQVEDDLDENREVPLHKDVQAYLKDIEFFFRSVTFDLIISDIAFYSGDNNLHFFRVTINRDLSGVTVNGDTVNNRKVRFMEINLDLAQNDLRIASIYTTKLNKNEEIRNWWNNLTPAWRDYFGARLTVYDTIPLSDVVYYSDTLVLYSVSDPAGRQDTSDYFQLEIPPERKTMDPGMDLDTLYTETRTILSKLKGLLKQEQLDLSGNQEIRTLEPLAELSDLIRLNCSNTLVSNLFPLRNLNRLEVLDISNTPVTDISPLQYSTSLKELNCSYTLLDDLSHLFGLYNLEKLECSGLRIFDVGFAAEMVQLRELTLSETRISALDTISGLKTLEELDVSGTGLKSLNVVSGFKNLRTLNADNTSITNVEPLKGLDKLEILKISRTAVTSLAPLNGLPKLSRIYWDGNGELSTNKDHKRKEAIQFMENNPGSLVIFASEELLSGWANLEEPWKNLARQVASLSDKPTREELHALLQVEEITIDSLPVTTLTPVASLYNLKKLSLRGTKVDDFSPVGEALELEYLDISDTDLQSIEFTRSLKNLKELRMEGTPVDDLSPLVELDELILVYADGSEISEKDVLFVREQNPDCFIVFKTADLTTWWRGLPSPWKNYFTANYKINTTPTKEQVHQLFYLEKLEVKDDRDIASLEPVTAMTNLKKIVFINLNAGNLSSLSTLEDLEELTCTGMPVNDLYPLSNLKNLEFLDLENTSVSELDALEKLPHLRHINVSGTQIKDLKPLSGQRYLESVEINNTPVKKVKHISGLPSLTSVSCYNTRISSRNIEKFKEENPDCKVVYY